MTSPLSGLLHGFAPYWATYAKAVRGFTRFGLGGIGQAMQTHGGPTTHSLIVAGLVVFYIVFRSIPVLLVVYTGLRILTKNPLIRGALTIVLWIAWKFTPYYALGVGTTPLQLVQTASRGPSQLEHALSYYASHDPLHLAALTGFFLAFVVLSYAGFVILNWFMAFLGHYFVVDSDPAFSNYERRHVAKFWTTIWLFMLAFEPGPQALISTAILIAAIMGRASMKRGLLNALVKQPMQRVTTQTQAGTPTQQSSPRDRELAGEAEESSSGFVKGR